MIVKYFPRIIKGFAPDCRDGFLEFLIFACSNLIRLSSSLAESVQSCHAQIFLNASDLPAICKAKVHTFPEHCLMSAIDIQCRSAHSGSLDHTYTRRHVEDGRQGHLYSEANKQESMTLERTTVLFQSLVGHPGF